MNIINMAVNGARKGLRGIVKRSPILLTGAAIAGVVGVAAAAIKAGPAIKELRDTKKDDLDDVALQVKNEEITEEEAKKLRREIYAAYAKGMLKELLPLIIAGVLTISCILGLNSVHLRRQAALGAVISVMDKESDAIADKAKEVIGEEKFNKIKDAVFKDELKKKGEEKDDEDPWSPNKNPDRMELKVGYYPVRLMTNSDWTQGNRDTAELLRLFIEERLGKIDECSLADIYDYMDLEHNDGDDRIGYSRKDKDHIRVEVVQAETPRGHLCYKFRIHPTPHMI